MPSVRLLGPLELCDPSGVPVRVRRRKQRELLGLLVVRAGAAVGLDEVVDVLWGDGPPASARANLHSYVSGLRAALAGADGVLLRSVPAGYRLDLAPDTTDLAAFEGLAAAGRRALAEDRPARAAELLRRGLDWWRGPLLADLGDPGWLLPVAARVEEARLTAVEDLHEARLRLGRHAEMVAELAAATARHPLRERLAGQLMTALHGAGQRVEALREYNRVAERLDAELGVGPGPELRRLHRRIRVEPATDRPAPALLPAAIPDLTGRRTEAAALRRLLDRPAAAGPVVCGVAGMAGVGKTALTLAVAHEVADRYPDGQLHVGLDGARPAPLDPAEVLARFLRALGVPDRSVPVDGAERAALYRAAVAGRRLLVVLDDAAAEEQVRPLLPGTPGCAVLITSRRPLAGLEGSRWLPLQVLAEADAVGLLARVVPDGRVAARPAAAAEVARLCGGLPLAVRIAGARLVQRPAWDPDRLAALLRDERRRLDRLAVGDLAVRASLTLGQQGLDEPARRLLRGLGLFDVPDFTDQLAAAVLDRPDPGPALEALVDAQLLAADGPDAAGQVRYRFHDLVRLYAREQAEQDPEAERAAVLDRGFATWLALAGQAAADVPGPCYAAIGGRTPRPGAVGLPPVDPLRWFDAERPTLLAAVRQACALARDELAFDLAGCLEKYFDMRGRYADWAATNAEVRQLCRRTGNVLGEAVMLRGLLDVRMWIGAAAGSGEDAGTLLELFTRAGERRGMSDAEVMRSWELTAAGRAADAVDCATRGLRLAESSGHLGGEARARVALAVARRDQGRPRAAVDELDVALAAARRLGNPRYEATILQFLGIVLAETGDLDGSERHLTGSLAITRRYADDFTEALTRLGLARVHAARADPRAAGEAGAALALAREHDMTYHVADALTLLGELALAAGRPADAVGRLTEAVGLWRARGWPTCLAAALTRLGQARAAALGPAAGGPAGGERDPAGAGPVGAWAEARELHLRLGQPERAAEVQRLLDAYAGGAPPGGAPPDDRRYEWVTASE